MSELCERFEEGISESLDRPLLEADRRGLTEHLLGCDSCARFLADLGRMEADLDVLRGAGSGASVERLWRRIRPAAPVRPARIWKAAAAVALVAIGFAAGRSGSGDRPQTASGVPPSQVRDADPYLSRVSAEVTLSALVPGSEDPGEVMHREIAALGSRSLLPGGKGPR